MANKQNFTPIEWTKVLEGGMLASMAVTAPEPSGLWGTLMETFGAGSAFAASKHDPSANVKSVMGKQRLEPTWGVPYRRRPDILNGTRKFPEAQPVN